MKKAKLTPEQEAYFAWEHRNSHPVTAFEVVAPYTLHLTFDDGSERTIDFEQALRTHYNLGMYAPLLDADYFAQVRLEFGHLTWPNSIDFNPAFIYAWDDHLAMLAQDAAPV